jgi:hypothetical protein
VPLQVLSGEAIEQNVELTNKTRYGQTLEAVKLDPFLVSSDKEADGQALALTSFIPLSGNWGFSFSRRQVVFMAKWNHRGRDRRTA